MATHHRRQATQSPLFHAVRRPVVHALDSKASTNLPGRDGYGVATDGHELVPYWSRARRDHADDRAGPRSPVGACATRTPRASPSWPRRRQGRRWVGRQAAHLPAHPARLACRGRPRSPRLVSPPREVVREHHDLGDRLVPGRLHRHHAAPPVPGAGTPEPSGTRRLTGHRQKRADRGNSVRLAARGQRQIRTLQSLPLRVFTTIQTGPRSVVVATDSASSCLDTVGSQPALGGWA